MKETIKSIALIFFGLLISSLAIVISVKLFSPFTVLAMALGIMAIIISTFRPQWFFYLAWLILPFAFHATTIVLEDFEVDLIEVFILVAVMGFLLNRLIFLKQSQRLKGLYHPAFIISYIGFLFINILAISNSHDQFESLKFLGRPLSFIYLYLTMGLNIYKSLPTVGEKEKFINRILKIVWLLGIMVSVMGVASISQKIINGELIRFSPISVFGRDIFGVNQNSLASLLVAVIPFTYLLYQRSSRGFRKVVLPSIFVFIVFLLLTLSRAGFICLALMLGLFVLKVLRKNIRLVVGGFVGLLILAVPVGYFYYEAVYETGWSSDSNETRLLLTEIAIENFQKHPVIGNGPGTFRYYVGDNYEYYSRYLTVEPEKQWYDAHSVLQKLILEVGILGVVTFFVFVGQIFFFLYKVYRRKESYPEMYVPLVAAAGVFCYQIFNTDYYWPMMWLPIGLSVIIAYSKEPEKLVDY